MCGRPAGWHVLADWAWFGRPGSTLPLLASDAGLCGGISVNGGPTACFSLQLLYEIIANVRHLSTLLKKKHSGRRKHCALVVASWGRMRAKI